ncbi:MAG TPA: TraB/GumN family protein, partial [Chitinophagaceae bacterium]|nr:TraB/GumN family protein [Chitinophagaceae bacterium]
MKRLLFLIVTICPFLLFAQPKIKDKKYQSLLWEITGNDMKRPSYLFGTMHVSNKLAFQLADSFYLGIRNADIVALETNPESWQEDMSKYNDEEGDDDDNSFRYRPLSSYTAAPDDYLSINTLKFYKYDKKIERSLYSNPSTINNLLYRTYGNASSDFEEDTYLDMYIYQCGKKWGKRVAGVERYAESMKLMAEAYKDAAKDKNKKERSYDRDEGYSPDKIQEAYRAGNLDLLDSINKYNSFSAAFDEKFLYKRNEIQANSIDSILRTHSSLFVGVGAAHLPGNRGVIELLRRMGYKLRPVKMGERDSQHKSSVEKLRVPVSFATQAADDGLFKVDIPGKFYKFGDDGSLDQRQYADMANGSYYMVTRVMTNAWMWGHSTEDVYKNVDSLLYENVPGKIITKTNIVKNGYKGFALTNKTRRGDVQRYNIFITPFEIIFFKMSGTGDYVKNGDEADRFFNSIQFKEYKAAEAQTTWKKYTPSYGGFTVELPHDPYIGNDGSW